MKASHNLATIPVTFDEDNLVPNAGLIAPALLAQRLGLADLVDEHVRLDPDRPGAANPAAKALTVLGGMLAGADCIEDLTSCAPAQPRRCSTTCVPRPRSGPGYAPSAGATSANSTPSPASR